MNKFVSVILCLCLVASVSIFALAEDEELYYSQETVDDLQGQISALTDENESLHMFLVAIAEVTLASILTDIGSVFEAAIGWVGTVSSTVTGNPLLLIGVVIGFIGVGVGLFHRLLNV